MLLLQQAQLCGLSAVAVKVRHLAARGATRRVGSKRTLTSLQELLRPAVVQRLGAPFPTIRLGDTGFSRRPRWTILISFSGLPICLMILTARTG